MKNYDKVVSDRYNRETDDSVNNSIYAEHHPIGIYSRKIIYGQLKRFIDWYEKEKGSVANKTLLDVGCGGGELTSFFTNEGFTPHQVFGIDLSETRIKRASKLYPELHFSVGNALNYQLNNKSFDLITAFDIFSHITAKNEIIEGLINTKNHLSDQGVFLWYDIYAKNHFEPTKNVDSHGFSKKQMIMLAAEAGLSPIYSKSLFKLLFGKYHSLYQAQRFPHWLVKIMEATIPGKPGNLMIAFKKI